MMIGKRYLLLILMVAVASLIAVANQPSGMISGRVLSIDGEPLDYASVWVKGTNYSNSANSEGLYHLKVPTGKYVIVFSSVGFVQKEIDVEIKAGVRTKLNVKLKPTTQLAEVIVVGNTLSKVKNSPFNATAVDTKELKNTTMTLSDALSKAPGMKIREKWRCRLGYGGDHGRLQRQTYKSVY